MLCISCVLSFSPFIYLFIDLYCHFPAFMGSSFYLLFLLCCQSTLSTLFLTSTISIKFIIIIICPGWGAAVCQRSAVLLWLQLWGQTPLIWENWIWDTTTCRTQQWRSCVVFYRVQPVDWRLWGQTSCFIIKGSVQWHLVVQCHVAAETPPPPPSPLQKWKRTCGSFSCHRNSKSLVCPVWATVKKNMAASVERTRSWCKYKVCKYNAVKYNVFKNKCLIIK